MHQALAYTFPRIYICGSSNIGRKMWPANLKESKTKTKKTDRIKSMKRGEFFTRQTSDGRMVWKDERHVYNLNTFYDPVTNTHNDKITAMRVTYTHEYLYKIWIDISYFKHYLFLKCY